jgi:sigma-B regulation protein RsbU (phosphoserine phosphatase)
MEQRATSQKSPIEDYARIQEELREAILLQQVILPQDDVLAGLHHSHKLDCVQYYRPSSELGGDYLAVQPLSDGNVLLLTADVSGHGITAALVSFVLHTMLQELIGKKLTAGQMLEHLNRRLYQILPMNKFVAAFLALVNPASRQFSYATAAAPSPMLLHQGQVEFIETKGFFLGINPEAKYPTKTLPFHPGDMLICYSDALLETPNPKGEYVTQAQLTQLVQANNSIHAGEMMKAIIDRFFNDYSPKLKDDLSLLLCRLLA